MKLPENAKMIVHPDCPKGKLEAAELICQSANGGKAFRHLLNGWRKAHHALIIVEAMEAMLERGKDISEIADIINQPHIQATNNSQWTQWLDNAIAVELEPASENAERKSKWVQLSILHADGSSGSKKLEAI